MEQAAPEPTAPGAACAPRCSLNDATLNECGADAYAVCGAPVNPWVRYYCARASICQQAAVKRT